MFLIVLARFEVLYSYIVMISIFKMPSTYGISYYIGLSTYALCYYLIPCPLFFQLFQTRKKKMRESKGRYFMNESGEENPSGDSDLSFSTNRAHG